MRIDSNLISKNVYLVKEDSHPFIIYAPMSGHIFQCHEEDVAKLHYALNHITEASQEIQDVLSYINSNEFSATPSIKHPSEYRKLSILSNYKCNLKCVYCYSAKGRSSKEISPIHMEAAITYLLNGTPPGKQCSLFFSGGGEPLISWKTIHPILSKAIDMAKRQGVEMKVHFMSNGTIFTNEIADFLKENNISICISFEVIKNIQNQIRGQYKRVSENILKYLANGNIVYLSSTITPLSVAFLPKIILEVAEKFNGVSTITMEPVTGTELFDSPEMMENFYHDFDHNFSEALEIANKLGIQLNTSTKHITDNFVERYCPGKLCLTPNGTFTICHCASSPKEERYEKCNYGHIDESGKIVFDVEKFRKLIDVNYNSYPECNNCFAQVHCGGECMTRRDTYTTEYMKIVCNRTRKIVYHELLNALDEN